MWSGGRYGQRSINESTTATAANNNLYFSLLGNPRTNVTSCDVKFWCTVTGATVTFSQLLIAKGNTEVNLSPCLQIIGFASIMHLVHTGSGGSVGFKTIRIPNFSATPDDTLWLGWHQVGAGLPSFRGSQVDDFASGCFLIGASTSTTSLTLSNSSRLVPTDFPSISTVPITAVVNFYTQ
jgi:hypothetical protein